ncbi:MAG: RecQ family ATP-dependent DNA helicase [Bacteroides sp.]|nr:RecQ family ATP-dependent DNA helicase [Bacteroides sp.]MCM1413660.1 RecQ family ATP-dependent DNA helicase [Bacteroides sp.]MCM1471839.1 RecQ family ATP-dependent DNA helicase [Bacteroides sp.]
MPALTPADILQQYWGYDSFRELQPQIISSILSGNDTLGLMPTGGGKSITFQVPALMMPHLTIVVTPLISLMKDQVDNLRSRDIKAAALHSGLSRMEQNLVLDRCRMGKLKLLYISPEKLQSTTFIEQLRYWDVSLIVVDEAHCISQWGYDFRPSYLKIAALRRLFPEAPLLALTASATPEVADDIMTQLQFRSRNVFAKSFSRPNISYVVRYTDDKPSMLLRILRNTSGTAIVYVRSRRRTKETAAMLNDAGISADFYHAGLSAEDKNDRQNKWKSGQTRVIVATNAFGMGIDKPDVRTVVHIDIPPSLEEYYQEAGRAGRDGKPSYAVIVASPGPDKASLTRRLNETFPSKDTIRSIYDHACNFLEVAVGDGYNCLFEFNLDLFCDRFRFRPQVVRSALGILSRAGYLDYVDDVATNSRIMILMDKRELYDLQLDRETDNVFQFILRTYTGLFADYVNISEKLIASRLQMTEEQVYQAILAIARAHAIAYVPRRTTPYIFFPTSREMSKHLLITRAVYEDQLARYRHRLDAMKRFVFSCDSCRTNTLLRYFGEKPTSECGTCDVCRSHKKQIDTLRPTLETTILHLASHNPAPTIEQIAMNAGVSPDKVIAALRPMLDSGRVVYRNHRVMLP